MQLFAELARVIRNRKSEVVLVMIKRILCTIIVLLMLTPTVAYADVVWDNKFDSRNRKNTVQVGRSFYINSADGYLISRAAPGSRIRRDDNNRFFYGEGGRIYENGHIVPISRAYNHRGNYWGLIDSGGHGGPDGWVPIDELLMRYEESDFIAEHESDFYDRNNNIDTDIFLELEWFILWQWPGSDREKYKYDFFGFDDSWVNRKDVSVDFLYLDGEGREWMHVTIMGGWSRGNPPMLGGAAGWVCLSEPDNMDIPSFDPAPEPILWSPTEPPDWRHSTSIQPERHEPRQPESGVKGKSEIEFTDSTVIVLVLPITLITGTVVLILTIHKFGKRK